MSKIGHFHLAVSRALSSQDLSVLFPSTDLPPNHQHRNTTSTRKIRNGTHKINHLLCHGKLHNHRISCHPLSHHSHNPCAKMGRPVPRASAHLGQLSLHEEVQQRMRLLLPHGQDLRRCVCGGREAWSDAAQESGHEEDEFCGWRAIFVPEATGSVDISTLDYLAYDCH